MESLNGEYKMPPQLTEKEQRDIEKHMNLYMSTLMRHLKLLQVISQTKGLRPITTNTIVGMLSTLSREYTYSQFIQEVPIKLHGENDQAEWVIRVTKRWMLDVFGNSSI